MSARSDYRFVAAYAVDANTMENDRAELDAMFAEIDRLRAAMPDADMWVPQHLDQLAERIEAGGAAGDV